MFFQLIAAQRFDAAAEFRLAALPEVRFLMHSGYYAVDRQDHC